MRKLILTLIVTLISVPAFAGMTATIVNNTPSDGGSYAGTLYNNDTEVMTFNTFCLEYGEHYRSGRNYDATIDEVILNSATSPNTLSDVSKQLYAAYNNGELDAYSIGTGQRNSSRYSQLQQAFWAIESSAVPANQYLSWTNNYDGTFTFSNDLVTVIRDFANDTVSEDNITLNVTLSDDLVYDNVYVLNLWDGCRAIQSQIIQYGTGGGGNGNPTVPAPGAIILSGIGTCLVGFVRRKSL